MPRNSDGNIVLGWLLSVGRGGDAEKRTRPVGELLLELNYTQSMQQSFVSFFVSQAAAISDTNLGHHWQHWLWKQMPLIICFRK